MLASYAPSLCLVLQAALVPIIGSSTAIIRQEMTMVMTINSSSSSDSIHKDAMRVIDVEGCRAAVHKSAGSKASFLLEPLLCWRAGTMEQLLCSGFDYVRSRYFLRVPVLLTDPAVPDKVKPLLRNLFPTSLTFMNAGAIRIHLATSHPSVEIELESQLGAVGGSTYLLLRVYCTTMEHCRDIRRGVVNQPSLLFEKLRLSLNSSEYPGLKQSVRTVSTGLFACQNERLDEAEMTGSGGNDGASGLQVAAADNQTKIVEVEGQMYFLLQQRSSGAVSFKRTWSDYENGFGDPSTDYWMGLRLMHLLTKVNRVLRVEMIRHRDDTFDQDLFHAEYTNIKIGPPPSYAMTYTALDKTKSTVTLDALAESRGRAFSTMDRDNDRWGQSCSRVRGGSGGWWFNSCGKTNPNGIFFGSSVRNESGIRWEYLDTRTLNGNETLKYIRILLRI